MNTTAHQPEADDIQYARAQHMRDLFEPWSVRKLEARTGIGRSKLHSKFSGNTEFTISDIEILAPVIRMTPEQLVAELYSIKGESKKTPTATAMRVLNDRLPELDSNQQPADYGLATVTPLITTMPVTSDIGGLATVHPLFG